jgi:hypothetical protein
MECATAREHSRELPFAMKVTEGHWNNLWLKEKSEFPESESLRAAQTVMTSYKYPVNGKREGID